MLRVITQEHNYAAERSTGLTKEFHKSLDNFAEVCRIRIENRNRRYQSLNGILKRAIEALHGGAENGIREATSEWDDGNYNLIVEALTAFGACISRPGLLLPETVMRSVSRPGALRQRLGVIGTE